MSVNHDVSKLDDLIVTTIDSIKGYEHSAEKIPQSGYAGFFRDTARGRREAVAMLQARSRALGGGDKAVIEEIERGEDYLKEEYDRVLADGITTPETLAVVRQAYESVIRGHDQASWLKKEAQAAA